MQVLYGTGGISMIYLELLWSFMQVGLFSIGGGYAAIPLIQHQACRSQFLPRPRLVRGLGKREFQTLKRLYFLVVPACSPLAESGLQQKMEPLIKSANFVGGKDNITALY